MIRNTRSTNSKNHKSVQKTHGIQTFKETDCEKLSSQNQYNGQTMDDIHGITQQRLYSHKKINLYTSQIKGLKIGLYQP